MSAPAVSSLSPSVLEQYNQMRTEVYEEVGAIQAISDQLTDRLNGVGKKVFEKHAKEMIQNFKNENLEQLKPDLKMAIENDIQSGQESRVRKAKIIATVALLVVGGIAATILAMEALVVASVIVVIVGSIFKLLGMMLLYGPGILLLGGTAATSAPGWITAALVLTFSVKGGILAAVSAVAAGIGLGVGIPMKMQQDEEADQKLTQKLTEYNRQVLDVTQKALKGEQDWEEKFNALIQEKVFTEQNLTEFQELLTLRPTLSV